MQISNRPEELVRQSLLYFISNKCNLPTGLFDIKVEHNNLDVAIFQLPTNSLFRPFPIPSVIFEIKRQEANLSDHEEQLLGYLKSNRADTGVLFNGIEILLYQIDRNGLNNTRVILSHRDLGNILETLVKKKAPDLEAFQKASAGDFESFILLTKKYGRYTLHKFTFTLQNSPTPITGCCFRYKEEEVRFDHYGKYAGKKIFAFHRSQFTGLISLLY